MKKFLSLLLAMIMAFSLAACGGSGDDAASGDVEMKYMTADEVAAVLDSDGYTLLDLRKAADYKSCRIVGSVSVDMDAAVNGDTAAGEATMKAATEGLDDTLILVCYSGKKYAQAGTNALSAIGYDMEKVFTLEGGFNGWNESKADLTEGLALVAFTGDYVVDADYVLAHMGDPNVLLVDACGEDAAKGGTIEGAIAVVWQMFADVGNGVSGDPMWGTLLAPEALSKALSDTG